MNRQKSDFGLFRKKAEIKAWEFRGMKRTFRTLQ